MLHEIECEAATRSEAEATRLENQQVESALVLEKRDLMEQTQA